MNMSKNMNYISKDICWTLCDYAKTLDYHNIPQNVVQQTQLFIADYYASALAGYTVNKAFNEAIISIVREEGGAEESTILFEQKKYPVSVAAYMNAIYAHGADLDDGNRKAAGHVGAHVMSAVFAMAEKLKSTQKEVIVAINAGYEFFNRIVGAAQPSLYVKGFHSTGVGGAIACAAACSKLLNLDTTEIYSAVSLASFQSSGLIIIDESGQCCKPINVANAAKIGVLSALLAQKGVEAPNNPLESKKGWFNAFSNSADFSSITDGLGKVFTITESYLKLYPSCRHTHSSMDAAKMLREEILARECSVSDIQSINISIYPSAIRSAGKILYPSNVGEAKFSLHYTFAVTLLKGSFGLVDLEPKYNEKLKETIKKIVLIEEPSMENRELGTRGASVVIKMKNGLEFNTYIPIPKGEGKHILNHNDMAKKMLACSAGILRETEAKRAVDFCLNTDIEKSFISLFEIIKKSKNYIGEK